MGALNQAGDDDGPMASINIVPFVDIVLVLLVVFMLTSAAIVKASFKVELPKAASAGAQVKSTINLVYTKEEELLVNGEQADWASAAKQVREEVARDAETQAVIAADKGVSYGKVVELIDLVKGNGVKAFALDIERGPAPAAAP
jgi:biopolymer transport protein ExbD